MKTTAMHDAFLDAGERTALLRLAAEAIACAARARDLPAGDRIAETGRAHPRLAESRGAFVTIYVAGQLRGCLGEIQPDEPLARTVARCASHAAYADYRFAPITPDEMNDVSFKISVLTPPRPIASPQDFELGRDGLILRHGDRSGVLLPEVPIEHGWDRETFLNHLWRKAGVAPTVGFDQVTLLRFQSQVFASEDLPQT
jgi:AmmeMemoRadiSam system protein A